MRTTWADWRLSNMRDAAESEARTGFDALDVPKRDSIATLPYYGAFTTYRGHVAGCADCREDSRTDCPEGAEMLSAAGSGLRVQSRIAARN